MEVDVLIVGAGPAGSTTARFCADRSLEVLMIDRRREIGHPVRCGEFLPSVKEMYSMFPRTMDLEELMNLDDSLVTGEVDHVDIISPGGRAYRCDFSGSILDRSAFDKHLAKLAVEVGARLETNASLLSIREGIARTTLGGIRARVIVGADGPNSRTASRVGLQRPAQRFPAITCQAEGSFEPVVKMYFGRLAPGGYAWIIPKRKGGNVGIGVNPRMSHDPPSVLFRRFVSRLGCRYGDVAMKFVPTGGPVHQTVKGNVLLVGDSAGHVMPTNGGGVPIAMIAGRIAGQTIKEHIRQGIRLSEYETRWRAVLDKPLREALRTRRLADMVFPHDRLLSLAMAMLGRRGLGRAIRCQRLILSTRG